MASEDPRELVRTEALTYEIGGKAILDSVSIDFWEGHVHAVVGPNGAGKSTLAATIMGLNGYRSYDGDILFNGSDIVSENLRGVLDHA